MPLKDDDFNWDEKKMKILKLPMEEDVNEVLKSKAELTGESKPVSRKDLEIIDLHFEKIMEKRFHDNFSSREKMEIQIETFKEFLNNCLESKKQSIVIIHGFGNGLLKKQVLKILKRQKEFVSMQDATYRDYGMGGCFKS